MGHHPGSKTGQNIVGIDGTTLFTSKRGDRKKLMKGHHSTHQKDKKERGKESNRPKNRNKEKNKQDQNKKRLNTHRNQSRKKKLH